MIASLFRRWRQEDAIEQLAAKCEALKRLNARLTQERDTWQETAIQATRDYNEMHARVEQAQERILSLELQLAEATSKHADKAEQDDIEHDIGEPVYRVVPESERPAKATRGKRGKQGNSTGTDGVV